MLFCEDCMNVLPKLPDNSIDLVLCDLPYGVTQNVGDKPLDLDALWAQYHRISKEDAAIVLFAQGTFYIDLVQSNRREFRYDLVWDKSLTTGFLNAKKMPLRQHEQIAVFYRRAPTYNPQFTQGEPLHSRGRSYMTHAPKNQNYGTIKNQDDTRAGATEKYPTSIVRFPKPHPSAALHRTEKPVELLRWLIRTYSNPGDCVLDNCMGAGGTGVAAALEKRQFIGVEIDPKYYRIAERRINSTPTDLKEDTPHEEERIRQPGDLPGRL